MNIRILLATAAAAFISTAAAAQESSGCSNQTCDEISDCAQAQAIMEICEYYELDRDEDGTACDELCGDGGAGAGGSGGSGSSSSSPRAVQISPSLKGISALRARSITKKLNFRSMDSYQTRDNYRRLAKIYIESGAMPDAATLKLLRRHR